MYCPAPETITQHLTNSRYISTFLLLARNILSQFRLASIAHIVLRLLESHEPLIPVRPIFKQEKQKKEREWEEKETHLLYTSSKQSTILGKDALRDEAATIAGPRAVHLGKHPLVSADEPRLVEIDGMIEADHHADARAAAPLGEVGAAAALEVVEAADVLGHLGGHGGDVVDAEGEAPQPVDARDGADEVAVAYVGEGVEVGLQAAGGREAAARAHPLARPLLPRPGLVAARHHLDAAALEGADAVRALIVVVVWRRRHGGGRHGLVVPLHVVVATTTTQAHERHGHGEDAPPQLPRLHGARRERLAVAHVLDVEQDRQLAVARQQEVAVAAVHREGRVRHRPLPCRQRHGDHRPAVDASRPWRMPERPRVGEDVLEMAGGQ